MEHLLAARIERPGPLYDTALASFARLANVEPTELRRPPDPTDGVPWSTLELVLQARLAALQPGEDLPSKRRELYDQVVGHELAYWRRVLAERHGPSPAVATLRRAGAAVALMRPEPERAAAAIAASTALSMDQAESVAEAIETCVASGEDGRLAIRPDPVADHLVRREFGSGVDDHHDQLRVVLATAESRSDRAAVTVAIDRASSSDSGNLAATAIMTDPGYWDVALAAAGVWGGPWLAACTELIEGAAEIPPEAVEAAAGAPLGSSYLRPVALAAARRLLQEAEAQGPGEGRVQRAEAVAIRLSEMGAAAEALPIQAEVVELRRAAAGGDNRGGDASEPSGSLAGSLSNLANILSELGRRAEALVAAEEAVALYRQLVETTPQAFVPDLAMSLSNLASFLSEVGRREEALAAAEEAVALRRRLAEAAPQAFVPNLATSLNNLASRLSELGRREEALAAAEEALALYRRLAEAAPQAFVPNLATSLSNLASFLSELGRRAEALAAAEEALALYRRLAEAAPQAFVPNLATSLNNLASFLSELGRREEALAAAEEAVALRRRLAEAAPQAFVPNLATSLSNLASFLSELGRREEALAAAEEALNLYRQLALAAPQAFVPNLATSLSNLASFLSEVGRREEALAAAEEAVALRRRLTDAAPQAFVPKLAMSLNNLSNRLSELGRRAEAWRRPRRRWASTASWSRPPPRRSCPTWPCRSATWPTAYPSWAGGRRR